MARTHDNPGRRQWSAAIALSGGPCQKRGRAAPSAGRLAKISPSLLADQGAEFDDQLTDATGLLDVESLRELGGKLVPGITRQNDAGNVARRQSCRSRR